MNKDAINKKEDDGKDEEINKEFMKVDGVWITLAKSQNGNDWGGQRATPQEWTQGTSHSILSGILHR
jgi:hypothetical protein